MDLDGLRELNGLTKNNILKNHLNTTRKAFASRKGSMQYRNAIPKHRLESVSTIIFALVVFFSQYIRLSFPVPALFIILFAHAHAKKVSNTPADKDVKCLRFFSCRPNSFFDFTIVLDFALKCYQCHGSDAYCHQNKLKRNQTSDACNRYHNKCITKSFEFEAGVKEVTRGCGNEVECRISAESCKRKAYPRYRCQISCCDEDYCNSGNLLGGMLCDSVLLLGSVFLSLTMHFHWTYL